MGATIIDHGIDRGLAWHYGDPLREQRWLEDGTGVVDLANRQVVRITGPDRRALTGDPPDGGSVRSQGDGVSCARDDGATTTGSTYWLSPQGMIIGRFAWVEVEDAVWGWIEGCRLEQNPCRLTLQGGAFFELDIAVEARPDMTMRWSGQPGPICRSGTPDCLGGHELFLPRGTPLAGRPVGIWAHTVRRIGAGVPRVGVDTDQRTLPAELSPLGSPRRLVRLHLDGSAERFLDPATPLVLADGPSGAVGFLGSMSYHRELGPIALGLVDAAIDASTTLLADGVPASVEELAPV